MMGLSLKKKTTKKEDLNATKFFVACQEGDIEKIKKYIHQKRIDVLTAMDEYGRTALHIASEYGHVHVVRYLIHDRSMDVEMKNDTESTALHFACRRNQLRMVQYLVGVNENVRNDPKNQDCGHANVRAMDDANHTALHFASYFGYMDIVKFLIQVWPENIAAQGKEGHTPLHTAAETGNFDVVQYLIQTCHANPNVMTHIGMTPLHFASQKGHLDVVKYLILQCHVPWNGVANTSADNQKKRGSSGDNSNNTTTTIVTPYDLAVKAKRTEVMEFLDHRRALIQLYFVSIENGNYTSFLKCIRMTPTTPGGGISMRNVGGNSNIPNGSTCSRGIGNNNKNIPNPKHCCIDVATTKSDENGNMALHVAASSYHSTAGGSSSCSYNHSTNGYIEIIHYILNELHINMDVTNDDGWTALHFACAIGHLELVQYFVDVCHVDLQSSSNRTKDVDGDTPLHLASRNGQLDIVRYLVSVCRVNIGSRNNHQHTPHDVAGLTKQETIVEYFVQRQNLEDQFFEAAKLGDLDRMKTCIKSRGYGIDVTTLNINQSTVLHFACRYGHLHVVRYLTQLYDDTVLNVNARNKDGVTPLHFASGSGHLDIVKYLVEEEDCHSNINDMTNDGNTAYDLALNFDRYNVTDYLSQIAKHPKATGHATTALSQSLQKNHESSRTSFRIAATMPGSGLEIDGGATLPPLDPEVVADRSRLEYVINDPTADPIVIGLKYLDFCTNQFTSKTLGEGAFGKVYLGYDHDLNNVQLAIKRIRFDVVDENKMNQITLSFRREIAVRTFFRIAAFILC